MSQALLGLQQLAPPDEEGGHYVSQTVQRGPVDLCGSGEPGEPVREDVGAEPHVVRDLGGEEPGTESGAVREPPRLILGARSPQLGRPPTEGEPPGAPGLGGSEHVGRDAMLDVEHSPLEVVETQRHRFAAPLPRVRREADDAVIPLG